MPKSILIDLNVVLDVVLKRSHHEFSLAALKVAEQHSISMYLSAHEVTTFAYILEKSQLSTTIQRQQRSWLLSYFSIVPTTADMLQKANQSSFVDFEDAVIEQAALRSNCSYIMTRNQQDFIDSRVPVVTPELYLAHSF